MLLPRPGDVYINKITKAEYIVEAIITSASIVNKDEHIVFHNVDAPMVRQQMLANEFESQFEFIRSTQ